jgi:hypothetical protein
MVPVDRHAYVATANGISLVYANGTTIVMGCIGHTRPFWRAVIVAHGVVPRLINDASRSDEWTL